MGAKAAGQGGNKGVARGSCGGVCVCVVGAMNVCRWLWGRMDSTVNRR